MASPFTVFRKHQKILIATLGLLAMIAFVFLPMILKGLGEGTVSKDPVVVTSKYGDLTERELQNMRYRRQTVINFLQRAVKAAAFDPQTTMGRQMGIEQFFGNASEESTVDLWLLVQRAKQLGMTISDGSVSDFISGAITDHRVTNEQFAHLYKSLKISEDLVFDTLQDELLAQELQGAFSTSLGGTPPAQRWEYFQRLNRKVELEVAAVPVSGYVHQVEDPGDDVLEAFFEEHKGNLANPMSPKPGFRVPSKSMVEYVKADVSKFMDVAPATDKEIEEYYKKNRDAKFLKTTLPGLGDDGKKPVEKPAQEKPAQEKPAQEKPAQEKPAQEKPAQEKPAQEKPAQEKPAQEKPAQEKPAQEKPAQKKPEAKPAEPNKETPKKDTPKKDTPPPEAKKSSALNSNSPFRLVSMAEDKKTTEKKSTEKKSTEKKPDSKPAVKPAEKKPAAKPAEAKSPAKAAEKKTDPKPAAKTDPKKPATDLKYRSLDQVREEIRRALAEEKRAAAMKAFEDVDKSLQPIREAVTKYRRELSLYNATKGNEETDKPAPPDFDSLAKNSGMTFHKTGLISAAEMAALDIGQSMVDGGQSFLSYIYTTSNLNRPKMASDMGRNIYMFWKTDLSEEKVPEFEDEGIRATVLEAWKMDKAREIARQEAEKLAQDAGKNKKPLAESIGGSRSVEKTGPFTWMTSAPVPGAQGRTRLLMSRVKNVDRPGDKFMRAVYDLKVGETGVAINQPENVVYVVQLQKTEPSDTVLWIGFQADPYSVYSAVGESDQAKIFKVWIDGIRNDANLKWERPPVPPVRKGRR